MDNLLLKHTYNEKTIAHPLAHLDFIRRYLDIYCNIIRLKEYDFISYSNGNKYFAASGIVAYIRFAESFATIYSLA